MFQYVPCDWLSIMLFSCNASRSHRVSMFMVYHSTEVKLLHALMKRFSLPLSFLRRFYTILGRPSKKFKSFGPHIFWPCMKVKCCEVQSKWHEVIPLAHCVTPRALTNVLSNRASPLPKNKWYKNANINQGWLGFHIAIVMTFLLFLCTALQIFKACSSTS